MKNPCGVRAVSHVRHSAANGTRARGERTREDGDEAEEVTKEEEELRSEVKKNPAAAAVGK